MSDILKVESITQVHEAFQLEKPKHPLITIFKHADVDFGLIPAGVKTSLDLYHITVKEGVTGSLQYGRNSYDFQDGTVIFIGPGQVITATDDHPIEEATGWSLMFHPDLIRKSELGKNIDQYTFFSYDVNEALHLSEQERVSITEIADKIKQEYNQHIDKHSQKLIISNLELLLNYCTRYYDRQFYTRENLNKDIVTRFELLLREYYGSEKPLEIGMPSVKYCGTELNMSPNYLSDLLKKETGRNAQDHIQIFVIEKAKTQLLNSVESISQIAYGLGFEYPQHFSKMFKKKTGMSPAEYRNYN